MEVFVAMARAGHREVVFCHDQEAGLRAIVAIHSLRDDRSLGGCRMWPYASEDAALDDVLRLSEAMTYKAAAAGVRLGGGKCVVLGDPRTDKTPELFHALGRFVDGLAGRYIISQDVGTSVADLQLVAEETSHVNGHRTPTTLEEDGDYATALGVLMSIQACAERLDGRAELDGRTIAVQGLGHVGSHLCALLADAGASLLVADIDAERAARIAERHGATVLAPEQIVGAACDVFAPCALGAVVDDASLELLRCRAIAGSANNVLAEPRHGDLLAARGILYAPDFVANGGGLMWEEATLDGTGFPRERIESIRATIAEIFDIAERDGIAPSRAAERLAHDRLGDEG